MMAITIYAALLILIALYADLIEANDLKSNIRRDESAKLTDFRKVNVRSIPNDILHRASSGDAEQHCQEKSSPNVTETIFHKRLVRKQDGSLLALHRDIFQNGRRCGTDNDDEYMLLIPGENLRPGGPRRSNSKQIHRIKILFSENIWAQTVLDALTAHERFDNFVPQSQCKKNHFRSTVYVGYEPNKRSCGSETSWSEGTFFIFINSNIRFSDSSFGIVNTVNGLQERGMAVFKPEGGMCLYKTAETLQVPVISLPETSPYENYDQEYSDVKSNERNPSTSGQLPTTTTTRTKPGSSTFKENTQRIGSESSSSNVEKDMTQSIEPLSPNENSHSENDAAKLPSPSPSQVPDSESGGSKHRPSSEDPAVTPELSSTSIGEYGSNSSNSYAFEPNTPDIMQSENGNAQPSESNRPVVQVQEGDVIEISAQLRSGVYVTIPLTVGSFVREIHSSPNSDANEVPEPSNSPESNGTNPSLPPQLQDDFVLVVPVDLSKGAPESEIADIPLETRSPVVRFLNG